MTKIILWVVIIIVIVFGIWYGVNKWPAEELTLEAIQPTKIGVILPLTGRASALGNRMRNALELASDEINQEQKSIELIFEDDKLDPSQSLTAYNSLVGLKGIKLIIGSTGGASVLAVAPIAEKDKVIYIASASAANQISEAGDYIFRNDIASKFKYYYLAEFIKQKYSTVATIFDISEDVATEGELLFVERYQSLGGTVLAREKFNKGDMDFRTLLLKIKDTNPDAILFYALAPQSIQLIKQIKELGISIPLFTDSPIGTDPDLLKSEASNDILFVSPYFNREMSPVFWDKYTARFDENPNIYAAQSYESLHVLNYCLKQCNDNIDTECIKNCLYGIENYPGLTGSITFDENGDVIGKTMVMMIIKDGQFVPHEE